MQWQLPHLTNDYKKHLLADYSWLALTFYLIKLELRMHLPFPPIKLHYRAPNISAANNVKRGGGQNASLRLTDFHLRCMNI